MPDKERKSVDIDKKLLKKLRLEAVQKDIHIKTFLEQIIEKYAKSIQKPKVCKSV